MTITFINRKGKQSIRATGKDAQALFDAMCRSVEAPVTPESSQNGQNPVPNHPKDQIQGNGADQGLNGLQSAGDPAP
jgi:hypothetical protein